MTPKLSREKKPSAQITRREGETERRRDGGTERGRDGGTETISISLSVSPSLRLSVSPSLIPSVSHSSNRRRQRDLASDVIVNVIGDHPGRVRHAFVAGEIVDVHHVSRALALEDV